MRTSYFCLGILLVIILAKLNPAFGNIGGPLKPEITVKYVTISLIFLITGLTLPSEDLTVAALRWDLHLFIQSFTFLVFPVVVYSLTSVLKYSFFHPALLDGLTILSTMPPPVSSAIILTRLVGGNVAASVFNSVFGSVLGIFITPPLVVFWLNSSSVSVSTEKIFQQLFMTVVVPLVIGQLIRNYKFHWLQQRKIDYTSVGQLLVLYIIYTSFCGSFSRTDYNLNTFALLVTLLLVVCLHVGILAFLLWVSSCRWFTFDGQDCITISFCGSHKSLTLGIPIIEIMFEGSPNLGVLLVPLLMYNPLQIVVGGLLVEPFKSWLANHTKTGHARRKDYGLHV